ncbi:MAG TPA: ATP-binding protein, partial [Planctomycetota bacterium]|nr:ATP-binding protein [Planctomycetota bacterium]
MDGTPPRTEETQRPGEPDGTPPRRPLRAAMWPVWTAVVLCLLASGLVWRKAVDANARLAAQARDARRRAVRDWAQKRLDLVRWSLVAARGLLESSTTVEPHEWRTFCDSVLKGQQMEWVTGLHWIESFDRTAAAHLGAAQRVARATGGAPVKEFRVWPEREDAGPEARILLYTEPEAPAGAALGFDATTDRGIAQALSDAAEGDVALTGAMRMPWEEGRSATSVLVVLHVPVRGRSNPKETGTPEGWVAATVSLDLLFAPAGTEARPSPEVAIRVLEVDPPARDAGRAPAAVVVPWPTARYDEASAVDPARESLHFGGRTWEIEFRPPAGDDPAEGRGQPGLVLALGLALTALVAAMLSSLARTWRNAERLAQRMTAALQASEIALRTTFEAVPDGLVVTDEYGAVTAFNPAAERLFDWPRAEIVGRDVRALFADGSKKVGESIFGFRRTPLTEGPPAGITARRRDGTSFAAEVHARDAGVGGRRQVTALFRDVTERQRAEEERRRQQSVVESQRSVSEAQAVRLAAQAHELEIARDEADASARAKSEFLAAVSHEIRTPLNAILGMAHLLLAVEARLEQEEFARTIRTSAGSLLAILNDILDVSKIEAGRVLLESAPFDLRAACHDVLDLIAPEAALKGLELVQRFAPGTPRHVVGDAGRFRQVLLNLVHNAVKFTERGHVLVDVRALETSPGDTLLEVRVEDTGIGIPPDKVAGLFRRFAQADSSTTRRYGGTGLGLLICRLLVERMGGTVSLDAREGGGSTFRFTVRLPNAPGAPPEPGPDPALAGRRLLLAADAELVRRVTREEAEALGLVVEEADGPVAALAALEAAAGAGTPIGAVFLIADAEDGQAADLVARVRANPAIAHTPIALVVDAPHPGGTRAAEDAGFDAYLVRPVRHQDFHDAARALLLRETGARAPIVTRQTLAGARRSAPGSGALTAEDAAARM